MALAPYKWIYTYPVYDGVRNAVQRQDVGAIGTAASERPLNMTTTEALMPPKTNLVVPSSPLHAPAGRAKTIAELAAYAKSLSLADLSQVLEEGTNAAKAEKTLATYASGWKGFVEFCARRGFRPLPASSEAVSYYIAERAFAGLKHNTLNLDRAAIRHFHVQAGHVDPTKAREVQDFLKGHQRLQASNRIGVAKKEPLLTDDIRRLCSILDNDNSLQAIRNKALILFTYAGALRVSEAIARRIGDVPITSRGIAVYLATSKGDQTGKGQYAGILRGANPETCPVLALATWLEAMKKQGITDKDRPLFPRMRDFSDRGLGVRIHNRPIGTNWAREILKAACKKAKIPDENISFHSLRRGHIEQAMANDASIKEALAQGRWKNPETLMEYWSRRAALDLSSSCHLGL